MNPARNKLLFLIFSGIFLIQLVLIFLSEDFYGGADNISHYQIARYAWKYPAHFFDLWGKPVYTTLVFPFALFGIQVARMFNVLAGLAAVFFTIRIMRLLGEKDNLSTIVFITFSPVYFMLMQSCLTEILFSLVLILSFWLYFKERYGLAALILSFLPYTRTEGILILPLFAAALAMGRQYRAIPVLATGSLLYTLAGYLFFHDWLWIMHRIPYSMDTSIYGSGSLFHFLLESPQIFGEPFLIFLMIGLVAWTLRILKSFKANKRIFLACFLIVGSFAIFFVAHSYVWWKGIMGSMGLIRVIAGVIPPAAIVATIGFNEILSRIKIRKAQVFMIAAVIACQMAVPFVKHDLPVRPGYPETMMLDASYYLQSLHKPAKKIFYFDPYLIHFLDLDPFDPAQAQFGVHDRNRPSNDMKTKDILVWDAHFGPNEGGIQLADLMNDPRLQLIKTLLPKNDFKVLGGYDYGIYIFRRRED